MAEQDSQLDPMSIPIGRGVAVASTFARSNIAPHLVYYDLRNWIEEARKLGEIKEVKGLSWQHDIGMVSEMALHDDNAPCFIFEDVPGTIEGSRVLVNFFGGKRKKGATRSSSSTILMYRTSKRWSGHLSLGPIRRPRSTLFEMPGRLRSILASSRSERRWGTTPTAAPSSMPAGHGTGAENSPPSMPRHQKSGASHYRNSDICSRSNGNIFAPILETSMLRVLRTFSSISSLFCVDP